jgi:hypothetical protein
MSSAVAAIGLVSLACLVGGLVFASLIVMPVLGTTLEPQASAALLRRLFPRFYLYVILTSAVAMIGVTLSDPYAAYGLLTIAAVAAWMRQILMPITNRLGNADLAGDARAKQRFAAAQRMTIIVNLCQTLGALAIMARIALRV